MSSKTIILMKKMTFLAFSLLLLTSCSPPKEKDADAFPERRTYLVKGRYNVAFLIMDGVYNTELTAPYDIFQHTQYREGVKAMNVFTVANTRGPITTFEGMRILPDLDYTKDVLPQIDILVVPSAEHHLDTDLEDTVMLDFCEASGQECSLCHFVL